MKALLLAVFALGCASVPQPKTVVVERPVYVFVPERSGPPVPPGEGIAPSPLLIESERQRAESFARLPVPAPPQEPVVYVQQDYGLGLGYGYGWHDPYPYVAQRHSHEHETTVVVVERDGDKRERHRVGHHGKRHNEKRSGGTASEKRVERAVDRCGGRATHWARERCYRGVARK